MPNDIVIILSVGAGITLLLIVLLPILRASAQRRTRRYQERARVLEGFMLKLITAEQEGIPLKVRAIFKDHVLLRDFVQEQLHYLKGLEKVKILSVLEESGLVGRYESFLKSRSLDKRAEATEVLGDLGYLPVLSHLVKGLSRRRGDLAAASIRASARVLEDLRYRSGESWEELFESAFDARPVSESLMKELIAVLRDCDRWIESVTLEALASLGELAFQKLVEALDDPDEVFRARCANACGRLRNLSAVPKLTELLEDAATDVRARACASLGVLGDVRAAEKLVPKTTESRWPVRAQAVKALGLLGDERYLPTVKAALKDSSWWVRTNAVEALPKFEQKGVQTLLEVLHGDDQYARERAAQKLQHLGAIQNLLHRWLEEGDPGGRKAALDFCRTGFFSALLSRFQAKPDYQAEILELVLEVLESLRADLESGVERRFSLSSGALKRMERDLFPDKLKKLRPLDASLKENMEKTLNLYRNLQELCLRADMMKAPRLETVDQKSE